DGAALRRLGFSMREQIVHGRALGIGDADDDVVLLFPQVSRNAGNGPAGADGADEAVDLAAGLLPDFRPRGDVVGLAVVRIVPLVRKYHTVGLVLAHL